MHGLSIRNVSKSFAGAKALSSVDLDLIPGEVHALMGENGAGKSTLIKILAGVQSADSLEVLKDGKPITLATSADAHNAGFRFIHQELNIVPHLSVAENISLGIPYPLKFGIAIDWRALENRATDALARLGVDHINVRQKAAQLSTGDRMLTKIASSLVSSGDDSAEFYVLDEPTASLSGDESEKLFQVIAELKKSGMAILYVSHRMNEVMSICDRVSVLRDGEKVFTAPIADTNRDDIIFAMTGRTIGEAYPARAKPHGTQIACAAKAASTAHVKELNFELRSGEILGIAGLANAGQSEILRAIMGLTPIISGRLDVLGKLAPTSPTQAWRRKISYVPRERRSEGLMLQRNVRDNVVLPHLDVISHLKIFANQQAEIAKTQELSDAVRLKSDSQKQPVYQLSGGNQQKVVFARAIGANPSLLLLDEPTRGVDIGAKFDIYKLVRQLSEDGCAIILTSSDLPEILGMCDRILILQDGTQSDIISAKDLKPAQLLAQFYETRAA
ncbi:MAG: ABC transporter ATP-binding protein [Hyphomicrobiales bacterium]|nr:MAG: ABC transporter ATP-binding protein [Hyphomicrobiales bacterium]